ncbi:hypothetical protein ACK38W_09940 [Aeromonas veronii]
MRSLIYLLLRNIHGTSSLPAWRGQSQMMESMSFCVRVVGVVGRTAVEDTVLAQAE